MKLNEKKKELTQKQFKLKLECQELIYNYQDFLDQQRASKNKQLEENNPVSIK